MTESSDRVGVLTMSEFESEFKQECCGSLASRNMSVAEQYKI
jgi:hypothetical protein